MGVNLGTILVTSGVIPSIPAGGVVDVQAGLLKKGQVARPHFIDIEGPCAILATHANGRFSVWNFSSAELIDVSWKAEHSHSFEQDPIETAVTDVIAGTVPSPSMGGTFIGLTDTPNDPPGYTGFGTFGVRVRADELGLEFFDLASVIEGIQYSWPDAAGRIAQTGQVEGSLGVQRDTGDVWRYSDPPGTWAVFFNLNDGGGGGKALAPTYVVGSADAGDTAADCDFLHQNGVFDGVTAAVNAANATGGIVYIRRGIYQIPGSLNTTTSVWIVGEGDRTTLNFINTRSNAVIDLLGSESSLRNLSVVVPNSDMTANALAPIWIRGDEVTIRDVYVYTGVGPINWIESIILIWGDEARLENVVYHEAGETVNDYVFQVGDQYSRADNVVIKDCYAIKESNFLSVLRIESSIVCVVDSCQFYNNFGAGAFSVSINTTSFVQDVIIESCKLIGGIDVQDQNQQIENLRINKNKIESNDVDGIRIYSPTWYTLDSSIVDNNIEIQSTVNNNLSCIYLSGFQRMNVQGNLLRTPTTNTGHRGIFVGSFGSASIADNQVYMLGSENAQRGIQLWTNSDRCSVKGNYIELASGQEGIYVQGDHHTIDGNTIYQANTFSFQYGIHVQSGTYITITGNDITELGNAGFGIFVDPSSQRIACNSNVIQTNGVTGTGISIDSGGAAVKGTCTGNVVNPGGTPITVGAQIISANNQVT